jgi:hypothetical protein
MRLASRADEDPCRRLGADKEVGYDERTFDRLTALYRKGESRDLVRTLH